MDDEKIGVLTPPVMARKRQRSCAQCTLCCTLLPVNDMEMTKHFPATQLVGLNPMDKKSGERCRHQCSQGCRVYRRPGMPASCAFWECQWLLGEDVGERPDRSHVVVDTVIDAVRLTPADGSEPVALKAIQVWVDPRHRDAHRNDTLRRWLAAACAKLTAVAIVRYSSSEGFVLFPPCMTPDGEWHEHTSNIRPKGDPSTQEDYKSLGLRLKA